jgi:4-hydroxy-4-methyl-2-oxoglutarate aldolase
MTQTQTKTEYLKRLTTFDTPTICNVIELFSVRPNNTGYLDARITACFPDLPPVVGFAATATFRSDAPPPGANAYGSVPEQIERFAELSGPPIVVFQDLDDPACAATFGEMMCTAYQRFGAVALITSGAGRDLDQVRAIDFPVFTGGTISAHGYCHVVDIHTPVRVGGVTISPDVPLHADRNGITTIPREIFDEVADAATEFVAAEAYLLEVMRDKQVTLAAYREGVDETRRRIAVLAARVSRKR